jgi:hypothetical protein
VLAIEWASLSHAGAFLIGTIFGTVVTLRVLHIAVGLVKRSGSRDD